MHLPSSLASEQLLLALVDALPDALFVVRGDGSIVAVNSAAQHLFGYTEEELLGRSVETLIPERLRHGHEQTRLKYLAQPTQRNMAQGRELLALRRDGRELSVQIALSPVAAPGPRLVVVALRETPDHIRLLRQTEERYRSALAQAPDAVFVADLSGRYTEVNPAACRLLGYTEEQLLRKTIMDLVPAEDSTRLAETKTRLLVPGAADVATWTLLRADGTRLPVEVSAMIHPDGRWQQFVRDISERQRAEAAIALALHELETVLEMLPDPVAIRIDECFAYVNPAWLRLLGYSHAGDLVSKSFASSVHVDDIPLSERLMSATADEKESFELRLVAKDGSAIPLDFPPSLALHYQGKPARLVVAHDRRAERRVAAALAARERLATVGTLAAGVGHELNNPLQNVTMNLELLREELERMALSSPSPRARELVQMTNEALLGTERLRKIVLGLHTFSRGEREEKSFLDVRTVLGLSLDLTQNELRHRLRVERDLRPVPTVLADDSKLAQVFINLLVNAAQAMPDRPEESNVVRVTAGTDDRGHAVVEISDNGIGMTADVRRHIFEPFFTTKPVGQGTGLGLAISYNIVTSLGGQLDCESEPGVGTTFRISLPPASETPTHSVLRQSAPKPPVRSKILLIEDEAVVARLLQRVLSREHDVDIAEDGARALELLTGDGDYAVILCDVMMPRLNGMELFERVLHVKPWLAPRFVFTTGGATRADVEAFLDSVPNEKLYKPFSLPDVRLLVSKMVQSYLASEPRDAEPPPAVSPG